tara:strand:- start:802 stop:936 length:135 start_codon:yes stop_codon:yes gene_type:complete
VINLKKEVHGNTRKIKVNTKKDSKNRHVIRVKVKVDNILKYPTL